MSTKVVVQIIFASFIIILLVGFILFRSSLFPDAETEETTTPTTIKESTGTTGNEMKVDRIKIIEDAISTLKKEQEDQDSLIVDLSEKVNDLSTASAGLTHKKIFDTKQNQGSLFTTTSAVYTPMNMFVNITCPQKCVLWINYYSSSKNDSSNTINTYGLFLNGQDKGIYSQASTPVANGAVPASLNATLPVNSGSHTVEIKTKTSSGTLQSDVSFLQVLAIEQ